MVRNKTKWFFLEPFLNKDREIHLSELSRMLKTSHTIVRRYLMDYEKQGFLKKEIIGRQTFYKLNFEFPLIIDFLSIVEKEKLIRHTNSNLLLKELVYSLHKVELPIIIFGSFSEEQKTRSKDIDLLIIGKINKKNQKILKEIESKINKKMHIINVNEFKEVTKVLKKEILSKHLIINNSELILRWLR